MFAAFIQMVKGLLSWGVGAHSTGGAIEMASHGVVERRNLTHPRGRPSRVRCKLADKWFWAMVCLVAYLMLLAFAIVLWALHPWDRSSASIPTAPSTPPGMAIAVATQTQPAGTWQNVLTTVITVQTWPEVIIMSIIVQEWQGISTTTITITDTAPTDPATPTTAASSPTQLTTPENAQSAPSMEPIPVPATSSISVPATSSTSVPDASSISVPATSSISVSATSSISVPDTSSFSVPATSPISSATEQAGQPDNPGYCSWKGDLWTLCDPKPTTAATSPASALQACGLIKGLRSIKTRFSNLMAVITFRKLSVAESKTTGGTMSQSVAIVCSYYVRFLVTAFVSSVVVQLWITVKHNNQMKYETEAAEYDGKVPTDMKEEVTGEPGDEDDEFECT